LHNKHQIDKCDFDRQLQFKDSLFYDISAWSFDLAFNLNFESVNTLDNALKPSALQFQASK
jgi:hypothetical protein